MFLNIIGRIRFIHIINFVVLFWVLIILFILTRHYTVMFDEKTATPNAVCAEIISFNTSYWWQEQLIFIECLDGTKHELSNTDWENINLDYYK